jgi:hypothetical protein
LIRLDDATINRAIRAINEARPDRLTAGTVLDAFRARDPGLLAVFEGLL